MKLLSIFYKDLDREELQNEMKDQQKVHKYLELFWGLHHFSFKETPQPFQFLMEHYVSEDLQKALKNFQCTTVNTDFDKLWFGEISVLDVVSISGRVKTIDSSVLVRSALVSFRWMKTSSG